MKTEIVTITTAAGTVHQTKVAGWRRGICPVCSSDLVSRFILTDGEPIQVHECLGVPAGLCDHREEASPFARPVAAVLPDGRRYFRVATKKQTKDRGRCHPAQLVAA